MTDLSRDLRRTLESTIKAARISAEAGAAEALRRLGVFQQRRPPHLAGEAANATRLRLRAHAKSLGDRLDGPDGASLVKLVEAAAYIQWHRLLFARFLLERGLLRDATNIAVSLTDCRAEAAMDPAAGDAWHVAAGYAARMLPGVFPPDDPAEALALAPEDAHALRARLEALAAPVFQADDSLGWTYQFWRAAEKKRINESQVKIGAAELPAVTQLFTEPYMVRFLLHNTLGSWWAGKRLAADPALARDAADEPVLRAACALLGYEWDFLRFVREDGVWRPASGVFPGWPDTAAALTVLDPCCGSGHFLTEALAALAALRTAEEGLTPAQSVVAVLRDNLAGLEIDGRCVQIAAFALAVAAWRIGGPGLALPSPHVAWVGAPPPLPRAEFAALANGDADLRRGLEALHDIFVQAPLLGSLIEVGGGDLMDPARIAGIEGSIDALVGKMRDAEPERAEGALAARGMADAAGLLAQKWVLQVTNVPFLGRGRQDSGLASYLGSHFRSAKGDMATAMLDRMLTFSQDFGTIAIVSPQQWFFLSAFDVFRSFVLDITTINFSVSLGEDAWESFGQRGPQTTITALTKTKPTSISRHALFDLGLQNNNVSKATKCQTQAPLLKFQSEQVQNPDRRILFDPVVGGSLNKFVQTYHGISTTDYAKFGRKLWEIDTIDGIKWIYQQTTSEKTGDFGGCSQVLLWEDGRGDLNELRKAGAAVVITGLDAWKTAGVLISQMRSLAVTNYAGGSFDDNSGVLIPKDQRHELAINAFVRSPEYGVLVKKLDQSVKVTYPTLAKVPFDLAHWQTVAATKYPNGLPEPYSDDPTQWLFHSHPRHATQGTELHVALARLAGYRWPAETDTAMRLAPEARARIAEAATLPLADPGGLLALVPVLGERALADRLRAYCAAAWGEAWSPDTEAALIAAACTFAKDKPPRQPTLDAWLRTHAARQHAKLFHDRPFLWWITDGRADGFTAIAHYHRLDRATLERLAYTTLGDWISRLGNDPRAEAATVLRGKLALILEGEDPYDIFVRWKPLIRQPMGWEPDLDDGVRLNIRPFIKAGVLAHAPNVHYRVDRGKDVASAPWFKEFGGERRNDRNATLAQKQGARDAAKAAAQ